MSSVACRRRQPTFLEHRAVLQEALVAVAQESFFSFAERCDADRFGEAVAAAESKASGSALRWLCARVDFEGAFAGRVTVTMPHALAADLVMAIAGLTPEDEIPEGLVIDATGEFTNMVCGTWLTKAAVHRKFDLQPPAVTSAGPPVERVVDGEELVLINDRPVSVRLDFIPS